MSALRIISRGLFWLLAAYWVVFIGYTIKNLVAGGSDAAVVWYRHIAGALFLWQWHWGVFLIQQIATLAITLAAWFFGWRRQRSGQTVSHS